MMGQEGGCLCGDLRYSVDALPLRTTICHCRFCQRATGSAYLVEPIFNKSDFALIKGKAKVYQQRSDGSGYQVYMHFCDRCGTKIFLSFERFTDVIGVYGGTFDDPNWYARTPANSRHIFLEFAQHGTVIPPGIDTFSAHAMTNDGVAATPQVFAKATTIGTDQISKDEG